MATINLGRIKPVWQGAWNSSTQYVAEDIVQYNNDSWVATTTSTNSAPADGNSNWDLLARGVSAGGVGTTELADASVTAAKLAPGAAVPDQTGNSGKVLLTDGSSLSWGDANHLVLYGVSVGASIQTSSTTGVEIVRTQNAEVEAGSYLITAYSSTRIDGNSQGANMYLDYSLDGGSSWTEYFQWAHRQYGPSSANSYPTAKESTLWNPTSTGTIMWRFRGGCYNPGSIEYRYKSGTNGTAYIKVERLS